ncbi:MAG: hypothetical protein NTX91_02935 [candidate division SR1 bacterium]|nr:hypothetical protein [candidate division SR1 bacterium]
MDEKNKLSIVDGKEGVIISNGVDNQITTTTDEILVRLVERIDSDQLLAKFQELQLTKKREQYEKLQPVGFKDAPTSAKEKWEEYKDTDNLEKLQWIHDNVSYNADHTMNIIKLKKTFCEDVSGIRKRCNWEDAKQLAESKGYGLGSDYNDGDSQETKESSDWYRVINLFNNGKGDTVEGMERFRDMAGCNDRYRTATGYTDNNLKGAARYRKLYKGRCDRYWMNTDIKGRIGGFKDMK